MAARRRATKQQRQTLILRRADTRYKEIRRLQMHLRPDAGISVRKRTIEEWLN
jgi:hypothetical protein